MNEKKYKGLLYFIVTTILLTIVVQCYWNYNNYLQNKQQFKNQVQISLDNAIETYYANLAEANQMALVDIGSDSLVRRNHLNHFKADSIFKAIEDQLKNQEDKDIEGFTQILDSTSGFTFSESDHQLTQVKVLRGKKATDSIKLLKGITSIYISIHDDSLNFSKLSPLLLKELKRKNLSMPFALKHYKNDSIFNTYNSEIIKDNFLNTTSKTKFLKGNEDLELVYPNATKHILLQGLSGILFSLLLSIAIISCLFYLLKIIKHQKQLAEVKNDLISNITHEFKTPISTIGVALESIKNFNVINDKNKTKSYLDISSNQLNKLNVMVEKLLETATLDSESLVLNKDEINIVELLKSLVDKHNISADSKQISFNSRKESITAIVDPFHFENAINNIIDNAIKYGGNKISVSINSEINHLDILISDDGNTLSKANKDKIFEKFYRVPKGNTHDVKGFGIGLYYAKKIIQKHNGNITLILDKNQTTFNISLQNE
ncbi:MAG: HAMP domain-containing histidine kinase [Bacteroidia bacterium]|nr:HAMP domain-containing histidine kinase [Bacteroidia bacterium]